MTDFKNYRRSAVRTFPFEYPVELVWHTLAGSGKGEAVQPMEEDEWENTTPGKGEIYTKHIESKVNKLLAFKMKTPFCETVWRIEFEKLAPSSTNVTVSVDTEYTGDKRMIKMIFGHPPLAEIKGLVANMKYKLKTDDIERKRRIEEFNIRRH